MEGEGGCAGKRLGSPRRGNSISLSCLVCLSKTKEMPQTEWQQCLNITKSTTVQYEIKHLEILSIACEERLVVSSRHHVVREVTPK